MGADGKIVAIAVTLLAAVIALPRAVQAQTRSDYPNRPVTLIVPYGAGGVAEQEGDIVRAAAKYREAGLG